MPGVQSGRARRGLRRHERDHRAAACVRSGARSASPISAAARITCARQVERWSKQYRASETEKIEEMERLIDWLPAHIPPSGPVRLVHGDYRLDNLIVARDAPKILAVLDWELSTLGDPLADFTYHLMAWHMPHSESAAGTATLVGHDLARARHSVDGGLRRRLTSRAPGSIRARICRPISPIISSASPPSCRASSAACATAPRRPNSRRPRPR